MSDLEAVEREYRALQTKIVYRSFKGDVSAVDQRRLNELSDRRVRLSAPNFKELSLSED